MPIFPHTSQKWTGVHFRPALPVHRQSALFSRWRSQKAIRFLCRGTRCLYFYSGFLTLCFFSWSELVLLAFVYRRSRFSTCFSPLSRQHFQFRKRCHCCIVGAVFKNVAVLSILHVSELAQWLWLAFCASFFLAHMVTTVKMTATTTRMASRSNTVKCIALCCIVCIALCSIVLWPV